VKRSQTHKPMGRPKKAVAVEVPDDAVIVAAPKAGGFAVVYDRKGVEVRRYSFAAHGERYGEIAKGYAMKIGGSVHGM